MGIHIDVIGRWPKKLLDRKFRNQAQADRKRLMWDAIISRALKSGAVAIADMATITAVLLN